MKQSLILLLMTTATISFAQQANTQKPCSSPEASQFDFWVGDWDLTWNDTVKGLNSVVKILDGCVYEENFIDPSTSFKGKSVSVYNVQLKKWQQTWVDNAGSYLDFTGGMQDGKMILSREFISLKGKRLMQRMIFYDITTDKFTWSWEGSQDEGKTWNVNWKISYQRKKK